MSTPAPAPAATAAANANAGKKAVHVKVRLDYCCWNHYARKKIAWVCFMTWSLSKEGQKTLIRGTRSLDTTQNHVDSTRRWY